MGWVREVDVAPTIQKHYTLYIAWLSVHNSGVEQWIQEVCMALTILKKFLYMETGYTISVNSGLDCRSRRGTFNT